MQEMYWRLVKADGNSERFIVQIVIWYRLYVVTHEERHFLADHVWNSRAPKEVKESPVWHGACIYVMWSGVLKDVLEKTGGIRAWSV